jgi:ABC-type thiamine transport system ATPase subunit
LTCTGETVALMGRNGAGKSTLLRVDRGPRPPTRGKVQRAGRVALLLQNPGDYFLHERVSRRARAGRSERRGPGHLADRHPARPLRRRAPAARLEIVLRGEPPAVVCLDEPTRGMDRGHKRLLAERLQELAAGGVAVLVATHDAEFVAACAARTVLLGDGRPVADAPTAEVLGGGWYFATQTARILGGEGALLPEEGAERAAGMDGGARMSWVLASFRCSASALVIGFAWYERTHPSARVLALIATLAALAALGRVAFAPIPSVKPTTDIVLIAGYVLGGAPGFASARWPRCVQRLLRAGPWTPWQMVAWGGVGAGGALLARVAGRELGRASLAVACAVAGLAFGAVMNFSLWVTFAATTRSTSSPATRHLAAVRHRARGRQRVFCLAFGPALVRALRRFRARFEVTWRPARGRRRARWPRCFSPPGRGERAMRRAQSRALLERAQNADGGFGGAPGQSSTQLFTGWAALGSPRRAATRATCSARPERRRLRRAHARELDDLGERQRTILLLTSRRRAAAAGRRARPRRRARAKQRRTARSPAASTRPRSRSSASRPPGAPRRTGCAAPRAGSPARPTTTAASTSTARARRPGSTTPAPPSRRSPPRAAATRRRSRRALSFIVRSRTPTAASRSSRAAAPTRSRPRGRCRR